MFASNAFFFIDGLPPLYVQQCLHGLPLQVGLFAFLKVELLNLKAYSEVVDEIYYKVSHLEPWERGTRKTAGMSKFCFTYLSYNQRNISGFSGKVPIPPYSCLLLGEYCRGRPVDVLDFCDLLPVSLLQGFGSVSGSGSGWIRINLSCWIRIRIRIQIADPDPRGQKRPQKIEKRTEFSSFEVLDVLF